MSNNRLPEFIASEWIDAKSKEDAAKKERIALESELINLLKPKSEGSTTFNLDGYKAIITTKMTRKLDKDVYPAIAKDIPDRLNPVTVKETYKIDDAGCRYLGEHEPAVWAKLAKAITTTPAKAGVSITRLEAAV